MKQLLQKISLLLFLLPIFLRGQYLNDYELKEIIFEGNAALPEHLLREQIKSKESPNWFLQTLHKFTNFGAEAVYFDTSLIKEDIDALKQLYMSFGFFKTKIKDEIEINNKSKSVTLKYIIRERERTKFHSLVVKGLDKLPRYINKAVNSLLKVDTSTFYSSEAVEEMRTNALTYFHDHGYMLASSSKPLVKVDTVKNFADVFLTFSPGKRFRIKEIRVSKTGPGKNFVSDQLIKEIVDIKPGTYYSNYDITKAQIRLYRTNLFSSALVTAMVSDSVDSKVPLSVSADIGSMHEISPEVIANNEDNAFNFGFSFGMTRKNFLGNARKFGISLSAAAQDIVNFVKNPSIKDTTFLGYADLRATLDQPFLFGEPIATKIQSYFTLQKKRNEYNSKILGTKLGLSFEMPRFTFITSLSPYFNYEDAEYIYQQSYIEYNLRTAFTQKYPSNPTLADSLANYYLNSVITDNKYRTTNTLLGAEIGAVHKNDLMFPIKGYSITAVIEDGNSIPYLISKLRNKPFSSPGYFKVLLTLSNFFPLSEDKTSTLGVKIKVGNIFTYRGDKSNISLNQRFYSGGNNSIRGWGSRELVPKESKIDLSVPNENFNSVLLRGIAPGGFFLLEGTIEYRKKPFKNFGFVTFLDFGNTWNDPEELRYDHVAVAGGFGIRFYTDFVPLRLDFGLKLYDPSDKRSYFNRLKDVSGFWKTFQFHLGIGEAF